MTEPTTRADGRAVDALRREMGWTDERVWSVRTPEFRLIGNLFEIVSLDYWTSVHGYRIPARAAASRWNVRIFSSASAASGVAS